MLRLSTIYPGYNHVLLRHVTFLCGQLRFDQGVTRFFVLSRSATDETYKAFCAFYIRISFFEIITNALFNNRLQSSLTKFGILFLLQWHSVAYCFYCSLQ